MNISTSEKYPDSKLSIFRYATRRYLALIYRLPPGIGPSLICTSWSVCKPLMPISQFMGTRRI